MYLNPGLTGVFEGDQRLTSLYRNQWASVPVPYLTFSFAYDQKFYHAVLGNGFVGGGLIFHYDRAGDADLSWSQLGLSLSYTREIGAEHFLTAGLQALTGQRAFRRDELRFDLQFNGDIFDSTLPTGELFDRNATGFFDLGAGLNWFYRSERSRHRIRGGMSLQHFNNPTVGFMGEGQVRLAQLFRVYALGQVEVHPVVDLIGNVLFQLQDPYREVVTMAGARYHLRQDPGNELALELDVGYRLGDALIVMAGVFYRNWFGGLSYDMNTSPFRVATNRRGGPEIALRYIIQKVKPPETFKACPIF